MIWRDGVTLEEITKRNRNTLSDYIGIQFIELGENYLVASMPVNQNTKQPAGILHGGASCVLAETVGSNAANMVVDENFYCVGLSINSNHVKAAREGVVIATASPVHLGRTTQVWEIPITNEADQLMSIHRLTMMVLPRV